MTEEGRGQRLPEAEWDAPRGASDAPNCQLPACLAGQHRVYPQESCSHGGLYTSIKKNADCEVTVWNVTQFCVLQKEYLLRSKCEWGATVYLNKLFQEQTGKMGMVSCRGQLTHHSSKKRKWNNEIHRVKLELIKSIVLHLKLHLIHKIYKKKKKWDWRIWTCLIRLPRAASKLHPGSLWKSSHSRNTS